MSKNHIVSYTQANIRATEDNLSLGHEELEHKIRYITNNYLQHLSSLHLTELSSAHRLSESVSDANTGVKAEDSGICELDTSASEEDADSSLLISMTDH